MKQVFINKKCNLPLDAASICVLAMPEPIRSLIVSRDKNIKLFEAIVSKTGCLLLLFGAM